jgi:microcin C transport system substrate-binding protein
MILSRRTLLKLSALAGLPNLPNIAAVSVARAEDRVFRHALTLFDDIKYPPDFRHFEYVNPSAPKGGKIRLYAIGSFDSLNPYTFKGDSTGIANEALLTSSLDEPSTEYGLVAREVWHPQDKSMVVFRLRPEARFHDGRPMTVEDVVWSLGALKEVSPNYNFYYKDVAKAEQTGDNEVTFFFSKTGNRELPLIVGQLPVVPKHWWTGTDGNGKTRSIAETTLEPPLNSGAYRISNVKPGVSLTISRVADYWGKDLPVNVGQDNFDEIETIYFRDQSVALEAFKGDQYDFRLETSAKNWATQYSFPAVQKGAVIVEPITLKNVEGMQSWGFNIRRQKFQDPRVRLAFNYAFDFEWSNANLFFGQYTRSRSFFNNSDLEAKGLPSPDELVFLEPLKDRIPPQVFTTEYANPINVTPQDRRKNLREAVTLLNQAGWTLGREGGKNRLKNDKGETLSVEILLADPLFERIALPYVQELEKIGVAAKLKTVDSAQYTRQTQTFDYDMIVASWPQSLSPGNEQRDFWGSEGADRHGSRNLVGIKNPAIDELIEKLVVAKSRAELVAACRALDRVLIWNHYCVPMWFIALERTARWDRFGRPDKAPDYSIGFPTTWWWDEERAKKVTASK